MRSYEPIREGLFLPYYVVSNKQSNCPIKNLQCSSSLEVIYLRATTRDKSSFQL